MYNNPIHIPLVIYIYVSLQLVSKPKTKAKRKKGIKNVKPPPIINHAPRQPDVVYQPRLA